MANQYLTGRELLEYLKAGIEAADGMDCPALFFSGFFGEGKVPACVYLDDDSVLCIDLDKPVDRLTLRETTTDAIRRHASQRR